MTTNKEVLICDAFVSFCGSVREIIDEQDSFTLRMAYLKLCDCANANLKSILEGSD